MDTKNVVEWLPEWLQPYLTPEQLTAMGMGLVKALAILVVGYLLAGWLRNLVKRMLGAAHVDEALGRFLGNILRIIVLIAVLLAAGQSLGLPVTSLAAVFGAAGLAVGLALQGSLSHFANGVMILLFKPFGIGDVVNIGGTTGKVTDIGLFATSMAQPDGTKVTVPNSEAMGGILLNHTVTGRRRATIEIGVDYGSDLDKVREALIKAVSAVPELMPEGDDPGYGVVFLSFGGSSLDWHVYAYFDPADWWPGQEKVKVNVYNELNKAGIGIPFPQMDVHLDGGLSS